MLDAAVGRGCDHCEVGMPITYVQCRSGRVLSLCVECTLAWWPGRTADWWEGHHAPYEDHLRAALARAYEAQLA